MQLNADMFLRCLFAHLHAIVDFGVVCRIFRVFNYLHTHTPKLKRFVVTPILCDDEHLIRRIKYKT